MRNASVCIVIGFSFRDYGGINRSFEQIMLNDNKELRVEISDTKPNFQDSIGAYLVFNGFPSRYDYHSGGIQKLEKQLRSKYESSMIVEGQRIFIHDGQPPPPIREEKKGGG